MIREAGRLLDRLRGIHAAVRDEIVAACERAPMETLAAVTADDAGDTLFAIDRICEAALVPRFDELAGEWPCVLIAEGLREPRGMALPLGGDADRAELRIIVDPIDGTRGLMYQKRPAWILTGVAPNRGPTTNLADIELAILTEIPLLKQHLCDTWWAIAAAGAQGERLNRLSGERGPLAPCPSQATDIAQGYGGLVRFFPGDIAELAAVEDAVVERALGPNRPGKARAFNDQYASTGGQLAELINGHDRWTADLRPLLHQQPRRQARPPGLCCHPYDLCTELVAREAGALVTDQRGERLAAPLDLSPDVCWVGYANAEIRRKIEPILHAVLRARGLLDA